MSETERPLADPGREEMARQMFNEGLTPEEYQRIKNEIQVMNDNP